MTTDPRPRPEPDRDGLAALLAPVLCLADDSMYHHERTDDFPCWACKETAQKQADVIRDHLRAVLGDEGLRKQVVDAIKDANGWPGSRSAMDAALAVVTDRLGEA